ncbi:MAG: c-type cytochrome [Gammaproteobacteria bacterium]|jgi:cytochrome c oxidase cbb3-type subunit 3
MPPDRPQQQRSDITSVVQTPGVQGAAASSQKSHHEQGRGIYNFYCYFCHGYSGNAKTLAASYLDPKPRNFVATPLTSLSREKMIKAVTNGRPGTAMKSFTRSLSASQIEAVVDFVRQEFMIDKAENTRYHTAENGWPDHERYLAAFPFALGKIPIDTPGESLTPEQRLGKRVFLQSCVTCHDRARVNDEGVIWEPKAVSYPRNQFSHQKDNSAGTKDVDTTSQASPYAKHEVAPVVAKLTPSQQRGQQLFQDNCAFCHGADGTGRNWIGSFLDSHPRDLTNDQFMAGMTRSRLKAVIRNGLPGTTMSAWKHVLKKQEIESIIDYIDRAFHPVAVVAASEKDQQRISKRRSQPAEQWKRTGAPK